MKYVLSIYMEENALMQAERAHCYQESAQVCRELDANGSYVAVAPLHPGARTGTIETIGGRA